MKKVVTVNKGSLRFYCIFIIFLYWHAWGWPKYRPKHIAHMERHSLNQIHLCCVWQNEFNLWSTLCVKYIFCVNLCVWVYHFCHVKWLIIEYVINMATISKTLIKHKMPAFQGKLHIFIKVDATSSVPCTKVTEDQHFWLNFTHICMILGHIAQVLCKWKPNQKNMATAKYETEELLLTKLFQQIWSLCLPFF
jgi:hypothetical protein